MREFLTSGLGIVALVFTILGVVFTGTGLVLALNVWPESIGITVLCSGGSILAVGLVLGAIRLSALRRRAWLLVTGLESRGTIVDLAQNTLVRLNGRHPWVVRYRYEVQGCEYRGRETMMDLPTEYEQGATVAVIYDPMRAEVSVLNRT
jgi:hypothetical protein